MSNKQADLAAEEIINRLDLHGDCKPPIVAAIEGHCPSGDVQKLREAVDSMKELRDMAFQYVDGNPNVRWADIRFAMKEWADKYDATFPEKASE